MTGRPLFPGDTLVFFDAARGHWRRFKASDGITRLVSFGKARNVPQAGVRLPTFDKNPGSDPDDKANRLTP
jgi:hypothetical protein